MGAETTLLDLRELSLPILDAEQSEWELEGVRSLLGGIRKAQAVIVASPVYQQTVSGALKNALDYLVVLEQEQPPGLSGRVVGLVSVAGSLPVASASLALQIPCQGLGAWVLSDSVNLGGTSFDSEGKVCDLFARDQLFALGRKVVLAADAKRAQNQQEEAATVASSSEAR
jgi:FMN reductase